MTDTSRDYLVARLRQEVREGLGHNALLFAAADMLEADAQPVQPAPQQAIAQPVQPAPKAWGDLATHNGYLTRNAQDAERYSKNCYQLTPLYDSPPQQVTAQEPAAQVVEDNEALPYRKVAWLGCNLPIGTKLYTIANATRGATT